MRAVLVFCEGNHDVVFATRSLGAIAGVQWLGQPITDLPSPFGPRHDPSNPHNPIVKSFIIERIRGRVLDGLKLMDTTYPHPPSFQALLRLPADDVVFAILRSGGDDAAESAITLIADLLTQLPLGVDVTEIAAAFLFDADAHGVTAREAAFEADHQLLLGGIPGPKHASWVKGTINGTSIPVGLFVFHDPANGKGTLEDIIAPMVASQWPPRWLQAGTYLTTHQDPTDPVATKPAETLKAQICITGQFRFPGDPMTQVLRREGLPANHFQGQHSQALVTFLRSVSW
jgi:hypothetical protein